MVAAPTGRYRTAPLEVAVGDDARLMMPGTTIVLGRGADATLVVAGEQVSRSHATLTATPEGWRFTDHSSNGSFVDGRRVGELLVSRRTVVRLGDPASGPAVCLTPIGADAPPAAAVPEPRGPAAVPDRPVTHASLSQVHLLAAVRRTIGRAADNDVVVDDMLVSRHHAVLDRGPGGWTVHDLGSANGTHVNGSRVTECAVADGDLIGIGHALFQLAGDRLVEFEDRGDVDIAARGLVVTRDGRRLLDSVDFSLPGRSLTAVLGPSGSGKSTLLGALTGARPADSGEVSYGGRDLYADYDELRQRIGVVPQDDILHPQLTVQKALAHSARLRFPPDVSAADREQRIREVLEELGLTERAGQRIDSLSGGQRKRTSVALELLTRPSLLFLDEPTSGLDPGLDKQVMHTLRELADGGRTILVITHSVANLDICDRLLVLAPGGRIAYDGPPAQALDFFGVSDYADVFLLLEQDRSVDWTERRRRAAADAAPGRPPAPSPVPRPPQRAPRRRLALMQYRVLCRRTWDVIVADRTYLLFLVALPVVLSGLAYAIPSPNGLSTASGDPAVAELLLVIVLSGALMGTAGSVREFVKERTIYQRERAIGLSSGAYLAAKLTVLGLLSACQAAIFAVLAMGARIGPDDPVVLGSGRVELGLAVVGVACASMVLGLLISTAISNADRGMPLLVMAVMVQLVLSGSLFPLAGQAGLNQLSWLVPFRWGYAMGTVTTEVTRLPGVVQDPLWRHSAGTWITDALVLLGLTVALVGLVALALRRYDPPRRPRARAAVGRRSR